MYSTVVFVGDHPLVVACAGRASEAGLKVMGVCTADPSIATWADEEDITQVGFDQLSSYLADHDIDVLLSVGNLRILPDEMVDAVKVAINFHDGPLPGLAGVHTPMWALWRGETTYGVTWHVIERGIDEGDVLATASFDIAADETTRSMNMKAFAAAGGAFESVVEQLAAGQLRRQAQVGSGSYFGRYDRPIPAGAIITQTMGREDIDRAVRALDFGPTLNRVGRPLLQVDESRLMLVQRARRVDTHNNEAPGTVLAYETGAAADPGQRTLVVATPTGPVELVGWVEPGADLAGAVGRTLPNPAPHLGELEALHEASTRNEIWWSKRLSEIVPVDLSHLATDASVTTASADTGATTYEQAAALVGAFALAYSGQDTASIAVGTPASASKAIQPWFVTAVPATLSVATGATVGDALASVGATIEEALRRGPFLRDVSSRMPEQRNGPISSRGPNVAVAPANAIVDATVKFFISEDASSVTVHAPGPAAEELATGFCAFARAAADQSSAFAAAPVVGDEQLDELLALGGVPVDDPFRGALHQQVIAAAAQSPDQVAVVHRGQELTYAQLVEQARRIANALDARGIAPGSFVGISANPSPDMLVAVLGVLMSGCAYVPLDPRFPTDRLAFMVSDANMALVLTDGAVALDPALTTLAIGSVATDPSIAPRQLLPDVDASALAYMMYTSGSTGLPKGVMVRHGNVDSFLSAMEPQVGTEDDGVWLSVTTLSFDISVLELFYPLVRGWKVVLYEGLAASHIAATPSRGETKLDMSLFFFGSEGIEGGGSYDVLLEVARYADTHGFAAVWTPERHFHAFGGPFPNPSVAGAALAAITNNIGIRSGSCVVPLHHPVRVAEEWAVVDQLSHGRVGISVAAGWHPDDFVLRPQNFKQPKSAFIDQVNQVKALWRGETVSFDGPAGAVEVLTLPRPVQDELPVWYTTAGNKESFELAGREGLFLLTHLLGQSLEEVQDKVRAYRQAWSDAGHAGRGQVTLMLHTFVTEDPSIVRETVREPMKAYLRDSIGLVKDHASAFPTFDPTKTESDGALAGLSPEDLEALLELSFGRYYETSGLFGSVPEAIAFAEQVEAIDVDEIAALVDFGIDGQTVIENLDHLNEVRAAFLESGYQEPETYGSLIEAHGVTHLQCTPSEARIVLADAQSKQALGSLRCMLVGGEACPLSVAKELHESVGGQLINVYGPTETTIWSTSHQLSSDDIAAGTIPIGRPLPNTAVRVVAEDGRLRPRGAIGELLIGGDGVTEGYHQRPELTAEKFVDRSDTQGTVYRTGDLVSWRGDGTLAFHGRADSQVKVRGHRIELGEIEAALEQRHDVDEAVVVVHGDGDHAALVAHAVAVATPAEASSIQQDLGVSLPSHMVPERFMWHDVLPTTPNGKVDRKTLSALDPVAETQAEEQDQAPAAPAVKTAINAADLAGVIDQAWQDVLGLDKIDRFKSFFDHGGNSLQVVTLRDKLEERLDISVSLVDLFRYGSVTELADAFATDDAAEASNQEDDNESDRSLAGSVAGGSGDRINRRAAARRKARRGK